MTYVKFERLLLKNHQQFTERWVQDRIAEDPALLGLGDVILKDKERIQPLAGRLDLLLSDEPKRDHQEKLGKKFGAIFNGVLDDWANGLVRLNVEMARRKGTLWQREKGNLCRAPVATWPPVAPLRPATSRRVPINAFSSVERGPSGSVERP